ncbi:bifunctional 4-hydroxy-2-oxoglutarate aldolase/2-dehydro-3-deoxy-phosphogluconate aldolase [Heyndrickxia acidicola]|uniref:Bifunctional 4-hydroxy-2-oxoglutarate aldolase/2-dehydro-3-deoxy-phosphogluconate aldolase n=1 Tax=Heyndrickxia acidicola TaxID=209389 RepID=A0ABU6MAS3_9BACI|nr:bifunctional 4-hydroxy-2-oxoglutarate aldolase/2-dehydro-3-deoxy-phosphogluconate aldolase [Heyndrickxia acidicola]MED1201528.1 bifunctional 4-hydroxy-2-oxoglutarate aldolase/2-dehydro-3-deoxy-phosphogluconate aldolase [Heyndrickxia acidicola]
MTTLLSLLENKKLIAVLRASHVEEAIAKGEALLRGGIKVLEITFTIPEAEKVIQYFADKKEAIIGAGTITSLEQAKLAWEAGASFLISPGFHTEVGRWTLEKGIPYIPGVLTPTDILAAVNEGFQTLKLFPASVFGPEYMKSLQGPFPRVKFIPTGGITKSNAKNWLEAGAIAVGAGGSLVSGKPEDIEKRAKAIVDSIHAVNQV